MKDLIAQSYKTAQVRAILDECPYACSYSGCRNLISRCMVSYLRPIRANRSSDRIQDEPIHQPARRRVWQERTLRVKEHHEEIADQIPFALIDAIRVDWKD